MHGIDQMTGHEAFRHEHERPEFADILKSPTLGDERIHGESSYNATLQINRLPYTLDGEFFRALKASFGVTTTTLVEKPVQTITLTLTLTITSPRPFVMVTESGQ